MDFWAIELEEITENSWYHSKVQVSVQSWTTMTRVTTSPAAQVQSTPQLEQKHYVIVFFQQLFESR